MTANEMAAIRIVFFIFVLYFSIIVSLTFRGGELPLVLYSLCLQSDAKEGAGTPFGLTRVVVVVAQEGSVEEEGGAYKVLLAEVIDDGGAGVGDHLREVGLAVTFDSVLFDVDVVEDNQSGLGGGMEEPFACHEVVAIATTDGKCMHGGACLAPLGRGIVCGLDFTALISGAYEP